ncbi:17833_t:CDS:2 [Funneliformis caledonium]|uniref:17833_t:CDS:1 n=1 Tax=Funneliformis caledonium TaxID=1117310 RepID=A0A9N9EAS4_9GLOM|nr:17833_t:CDS:2 [Funneliformis caledonium]
MDLEISLETQESELEKSGKFKGEVDSIKQDLKQAEDDAVTLRIMSEKEAEAKKLLNSSQSRGQVLSSMIKLKDNGSLGNLGVIDKYDVAISTASPALNNIVVDLLKLYRIP